MTIFHVASPSYEISHPPDLGDLDGALAGGLTDILTGFLAGDFETDPSRSLRKFPALYLHNSTKTDLAAAGY
jgi:hypothetical protein